MAAITPGVLGYRSDAGYAPNFNCPMHQCDGGDCETCGSNPSGERPRVTLQAEPSSATPRCRDLALWDPQGSPVSCSELLANVRRGRAQTFSEG